MSDPRSTALKRAKLHGLPYIHRQGQVLVLVTAIGIDGRGVFEVKQAKNSEMARQFMDRACRESGWKTAAL